MNLRWPVSYAQLSNMNLMRFGLLTVGKIFNDHDEAMFLFCMTETHNYFTPAVELIARCQEKVILRDTENLLRDLINLKSIVD
jgi:hypothetical protein